MKVTIKELPENQIVTSISPIDERDANAEIEKGELVFDPGKLTLHKALGNTHAKGGTPVNLDSGTFIFSNFKKLALNKQDHEVMEFKEGGSFSKKSKYTPAKVLERQLAGGLEHHNKMVAILNTKKDIDPIAQQSAQLMLEKNFEKIGQVAFIQEDKKRFKDGAPEFSMGSAPVFSSDLEQDMIQAEQYNPYEHKKDYKMGGLVQFQGGGDLFAQFQKKWGRFVPTNGKPYDPKNLPAGYNKEEYRRDLMQVMNQITGNNYPLTGEGMAQMRRDQASQFPEFVSDAGNRNFWNRNATTDFQYPDVTRPYYDAIGVEKNPRQFMNQTEMNNWINQTGFKYLPNSTTSGSYVDPVTGRYIGARIATAPQIKLNTPNPGALPNLLQPLPQRQTVTPSVVPPVTPSNQQQDLPTTPTRYNVGLTPWQQINLAKGMADALSVRTYMPMRQQQQSVLTQPTLIDDQPYINQANQAYFNAAQLNRLNTNPQISVAANEQLAGQRLDNINRAIGEVQNQNVNILNQSRQQNANILNQDAQANRAFDRQYYDQVVSALQNRDDMKDLKWNQVMDQANQVFSENQAFNNAINSQQQYRTAIRDAQGNIVGYRGGLPYEPTKGFFGVGFRYNPNIDANSILNANLGFGQPQRDDYLEEAIQIARERAKSGDKDALKSLSYLLGQRNPRR